MNRTLKLKNLLLEDPDTVSTPESDPRFGRLRVTYSWPEAHVWSFFNDNLIVELDSNHPATFNVLFKVHGELKNAPKMSASKTKSFIKSKMIGYSYESFPVLQINNLTGFLETLDDIDSNRNPTMSKIRRGIFDLSGRLWKDVEVKGGEYKGKKITICSLWAKKEERQFVAPYLNKLFKALKVDTKSVFLEFADDEDNLISVAEYMGAGKIEKSKQKVDYSKIHTETDPAKRKALQKKAGIHNPIKNIANMPQWQRDQLMGVAEQSSKLKDLINEIPDTMKLPNGRYLEWDGSDAIPFMMLTSDLVILSHSEYPTTHGDIRQALLMLQKNVKMNKPVDKLLKHYDLEFFPKNPTDAKQLDESNSIDGRLWTYGKVISFWENNKKSLEALKHSEEFLKYIAGKDWTEYKLELHDDEDKSEFINVTDVLKGSVKSNTASPEQQERLKLLRKYHQMAPGDAKRALRDKLFGGAMEVSWKDNKPPWMRDMERGVAESNSSKLKDLLPGGFADDKTIKSIADKHNVSVEKIKNELEAGLKIEVEHTDNKKLAKEIALDHLYEIPDYYTRLDKMEAEAKKELKASETEDEG